MKRSLYLFVTALVSSQILGCGVRGDPLPPMTPPELGRGQPTFKKATEDLAFPNLPPVETEAEEDLAPDRAEESY